DRRAVPWALAAATDAHREPDRRVWHLAAAASGPDEDVAAQLERTAQTAQARAGLAAAAAFLERAVVLTADPARRTERALAAAQASLQAGAFGKARELLVTAEAGPADDLQAARADLLCGQATFASGLGSDAAPLLLKAAKRLELLDLGLARETYLTAWMAALFAGRLAGAGDLLEVSRAARALPAPGGAPRPVDLVLDGLARLVADGPAAAAPTLRRGGGGFFRPDHAGRRGTREGAVDVFSGPDISAGDGLRWGWFAQAAASALWDLDAWRAMLVRQVQLARDAGALDQLPIMLGALGTAAVWGGDFAEAAALIAE